MRIISRLNLAIIIAIVFAVGIIALIFTFYQITTEKQKLYSDLESRVTQIAERLENDNIAFFDATDKNKFQEKIDSVCLKYQLLGVGIYFNNDSIVINDAALPYLKQSLDIIIAAISADTTQSDYFEFLDRDIYLFIKPNQQDHISTMALILYADAGYINNIIGDIWLRNFLRWFLQALVVSSVTVLIIRWGIFGPINKVVEWVRSARTGDIKQLQQFPPVKFLAPLHKEIVGIAQAMQESKAIAEEEARLRANSESIWTPERLKAEVTHLLQNRKMIVVSNREPYMHIHEGKNIKCIVPASGMITAMEPVLKSCGGLWIASGSGDADKETVDHNDKVQVPPENPKYTLRRIWLTKEEEIHYYYGFSNEGLWPLCHIAHMRPIFRTEDWLYYQRVNENFAQSVIEEIKDEEQPFILIQDYHFALLPELIKRRRPDARVAIFWHIPWPNPESFGICPWQKEILRGILGADLVGFHTQYHCNHFLQTVNAALESRVRWEDFSAKIGEHTTYVKPFPISISFTLKDYDSSQKEKNISALLDEHGIDAQFMGIGVDRIDYTKGIIEKFLAIERFFEKYPSYKGKFTFVQIGAPSRTLLKNYSDTVKAVENEAERINWKLKIKNWVPILLLKKHHSHEEILPFYESADLCIVSSLHDGMNLVAKEFVASRQNNDGVLILSRFAGASQELRSALIINPYDIDAAADAIKTALEMPLEEQKLRMQQLRQNIVYNNIFAWAVNLIRTMVNQN